MFMDNDLTDDELLDSFKEILRKISDTELSEIEDFTQNSPLFNGLEGLTIEYLRDWRDLKIYASELLLNSDSLKNALDWEIRMRLIISNAKDVLDYDRVDNIYNLFNAKNSLRTSLSEFFAILNPVKGNQKKSLVISD